MQRQRILPLAGAILALSACGSVTSSTNNNSNIPPPPTGNPAQAITVEVRDFYFNPSNPLIAVGGTVTWT